MESISEVVAKFKGLFRAFRAIKRFYRKRIRIIYLEYIERFSYKYDLYMISICVINFMNVKDDKEWMENKYHYRI